MTTPDVETPSPPEEEYDEVPDGGDPYWDDVTDETLRYVRRVRAAAARRRRHDRWFTAYVLVLVCGGYGGVYGAASLRNGLLRPAATGAWTAALPCLLVAAALTVLLVALRSARWRGPVILDPLTVSWLLPLPVRWERMTLPKYRAAVWRAVLGGGLGGACVGLGLCLAGAGALLPDVASGAGAVAAFAAFTVGLTAHAATARRAPLRWGTALCALGAVALVAQGMLAVLRHRSPALESVEQWSGPWGWAAQWMTATTGARHQVPWSYAPVAVALPAVAVCSVISGMRRVPRWDGELLRARSRTAGGLAAAVGTADPRQARLVVRAGAGAGRLTGWRPPAPRRRWLLVPWHDLCALLGAPGQVWWGVGWWLAALASAQGVALTGGRGASGLVCAASAAVCGYLAAAQWVEPARTDADDTRRSRLLPYAYPALTLRHALLPTAALASVTGVGWAVAAVTGLAAGPMVVMLAVVPASVCAALVSANRGSIPASVFIGSETAWGNSAPIQVVVWHARAPLVLCGVLTPSLNALCRSHQADVAVPVAAVVVMTLVAACWAWLRAERLYRR